MIGYRFPHNGAQVVAIAPADRDSYVILCVARYYRHLGQGMRELTKTEYITALVGVRAIPNPEEWWAGTYHDHLDSAVERFIARSMMVSLLDAQNVRRSHVLRLVQTTIDTLAEKEKADA